MENNGKSYHQHAYMYTLSQSDIDSLQYNINTILFVKERKKDGMNNKTSILSKYSVDSNSKPEHVTTIFSFRFLNMSEGQHN